MSETVIPNVFVYGTLKPGLRYHHIAKRGGAFEQAKAYVEGFDLYHFPAVNYPAITPGEGRVYGWRFHYQDINKALPYLDELEGCHLLPPEYRRIEAISQPDNVAVWLYVYHQTEVFQTDTAIRVKSGNWEPGIFSEQLPKGLANKQDSSIDL